MLKNLSFSKKLAFLLGISSIIIISGVGISSYWVVKQYLQQAMHDELDQITESTYHLVKTSVEVSIRNYLKGGAEQIRELITHIYEQTERGELSREQARKTIRTIIAQQTIGENGYFALIDTTGFLEGHPKAEIVGTNLSDREFIQQAISIKEGYLEYMWKNPDEQKERAKVAYVSYFEPWDYIVFATSYKSDFHRLVDVNDFKGEVLSITLGETGYAYVMDSKGTLIIHPKLSGQNIYDSQDSTGRYFIQEICEQKHGHLIYPWQNPEEETPRDKLVYFTYLEELDWIIACGGYLDELYQPVNVLIYTLLVVSCGLLVVMVIFSIFLGRSLAKPVKRLAVYAAAIGGGDLQVNTIPVQGKDEIGHLARAFNSMTENLRALIGQAQQSGIQVTSSATELSATAKQQEAIMTHQAKSTEKVIGSVKAIADVTSELVQAMQGVASLPEGASKRSHSKQTDLARMGEAMHQMEQASKAISNRLSAINEKADNITTVVTTINKVADQTNLLSLNASIEAEKAGEYGRGFTVVAREIRRLADQTAVATLDIEQMVREMQSAVASGVMEMDRFIAEVRNSVEDVRTISAKLAVIIKQVQALSPQFEEVNVVMINLGEETQETRVSLGETYFAIEQLNEAAKGLQQEMSRFKVN